MQTTVLAKTVLKVMATIDLRLFQQRLLCCVASLIRL